MKNIQTTAIDGNRTAPKRGILRAFLLALGIAASAPAAHAQIPADATGYMVEVHTTNSADAGTGSVVKLSLAIRDRNWNQRSLGPWIVDHCGRNDHERNQWDNYFFPESTATAHIEKLWLESDGLGNGPGWNWDKLYVTRIENGRAVWMWAWEPRITLPARLGGGSLAGNPVWIYKGKYSFDFTSGGWGRAIPLNLKTPAGLEPEYTSLASALFSPYKGSIQVITSIVIPVADTCPDDLYRLNSTNVTKSVERMETPLGNGQKLCTFITLFCDVAPGYQRVEKLDPNHGWVTASRDVNVSARQMANASFTPGPTKGLTPVP